MFAFRLWAQDTRTVTEPVFPPVCTIIKSQTASGPSGFPVASETSYDTPAIQSALDTCPAGQAVKLQAIGSNDAFLIAPIRIPPGVTLLVDAEVTVYASRNPRDYDSNAAKTCGTITASGGGCLPLITANRANGAGVMGYGVIDGRGYLPMLNTSTSWWDLANQANTAGLTQNCPRLMQISNTDGFTLYKITLKNSPNFHVALGTDTNFIAWGVKIISPYDGRNTDGIDPGYSSNVTITKSHISTGDDNVAVGGNNPPGAANISVVDNWFGDGHGASIGSYTLAGVSNVLFDGITIAGDRANGNQNGIRIKSDVSRGGLVQHITYRNICMQNVRAAIVLDPFYTAGATGNLIPHYDDITLRNVHAVTEGTIAIKGHDAGVPTTVQLDNVQVDAVRASDVTMQYSTVTLGPGDTNFDAMLRGTGVTVTGSAQAVPAYACPAAVFSPIMGELIPGPPKAGVTHRLTVQVQVIPTKAVPYQTYLTRLKTDPNATLALPAPTGTVTIYDGTAPIATAPAVAGVLSIVLPRLNEGLHRLTAVYSGDGNYASVTFGNYQVQMVAGGRRRWRY